MKTVKRILSLVLTVILLLSLCVPAFAAEETGISALCASVTVDEEVLPVSWWNGTDKYYIFLPSDADLSAVTLSFTASAAVTLDGEEIQSGEAFSFETGKNYSLSCDGKLYTFEVLKSENLPSMHITTASGSMDAVHANKSHKEGASVVIASDGEVILKKDLEYIKGRGNATWTYVKKPYNIKFDKKTDLFGMGKAKKWTLLANYVDKTTLRNRAAYNLAEKMEIPFTSKNISIDLYINDEYYGNYVLCESVEVGSTRVDITDLEGATEDANPDNDLDEFTPGGDHSTNYRTLVADSQKWYNIPVDPENITGGYLLEFELPDRYINEPSGFVTSRNQTIVLKSPEYASEAQVKYISSFYQEFEDALYSESGYNTLGKHYTEYIDLESFVKMYIFQEFAKNLDAAITSFYVYKDADRDKLVAAPVWDFDRAFGDSFSRFGMNIATPDGWWAGIIYHFTGKLNTAPTLLNTLYRKDDFFAEACKTWQNTVADIINDDYVEAVKDYQEEVTASAVMNAVRWNYFSAESTQAIKEKYTEFVNGSLVEFIVNRKAFLNKGFADTSVRIFYESNGGSGNMYNESAPQLKENLTVPSCNFTHSSLIFDSWNTKADGSGTKYNPGDKVTLDSTKLTFYAQWKEKPAPPVENPVEPEPELNWFQKIIQSIKDFFNSIRDFFVNLF